MQGRLVHRKTVGGAGCRLAGGLVAAPMLQALIDTHSVYLLEQLGLIFRNTLMGAIFRLSLIHISEPTRPY